MVKKRFLNGLTDKSINSDKLLVFYQSAKKASANILKKKKNIITFVGKLNRAKGYDIFAKAIINVLNKNRDWQSLVIGDEKREKIDLNHKRLKILGFLSHNKVINIFKKT
ncbi:MAG: glycosyltransferase, partial [Pelagibacteraceae bacterium]